MKIHELLNEAKITDYTKKEIIDFPKVLRENCSEAMEKMIGHTQLWRGSRSNIADALLIDVSTGMRKSENSSNYYTLIMDNSPYMKNWPKRSNSMICTTSAKTASSYSAGAGVYAIFPFNGTKLAVCPKGDLWDTMIELPGLGGRMSWDEINYFLRRLGFDDDSSYQSIIDYSKSEEFYQKFNKIYPDISPDNFIAYLQERMSPANVGFELIPVSAWSDSLTEREVWFSAPCVAIKRSVYDNWINS